MSLVLMIVFKKRKRFENDYRKLKETLTTLPNELKHDIMV